MANAGSNTDAASKDKQVNSMNNDLIKREQLSALVDGETSSVQMQEALAYAESDEGQQSWSMYHLIGDVMRSPEFAHHTQHDVLSAVRAQIAKEPRPQANVQSLDSLASGQLEQIVPAEFKDKEPVHAVGNGAKVISMPARGAANASVFRWKMAAGFASVAAVAAIGWGALLGNGVSPDGAGSQLALAPQSSQIVAAAEQGMPLNGKAQSSSVVAVAGPNGQSVMLRDPRLDELLAAQSQQSSAANLQMPASFLRNANFATVSPAQQR